MLKITLGFEVLGLPRCAFYGCDKTPGPKVTWRGKGLCHLRAYSPSLCEVRAGTLRQELKQRPWESSVYWLASLTTSAFLHTPGLLRAGRGGGGTIHSGLDLGVSKINQDVPQV